MRKEIREGDIMVCPYCKTEFSIREICCNEDSGEHFTYCSSRNCELIPITEVHYYIDVEDEDE